MKKIFLFIVVFSGFLYTGCDLERLPYTGYTEETVKQDAEGSLDILLNGCYGQMREWTDVMHRVGEYGGDNMNIRGSSSDPFYDFISLTRRATSRRLNTFWNYSYKIIAQTSDVIKIYDTPPTPEVAHQIGEAYYLRGIMYFYLCRGFGRPYYQSPETNLGVPIINGRPENILVDNITLPDRATVKEVYAQVISDLRNAESLMSINKAKIYATKEAAQAMLSLVYLYMSGTYENTNMTYADSSIYYANQVLASGRFTMLSRANFMRMNELTPEQNSEVIFAVKRIASEFTEDDYEEYIGSMYATVQGIGWGEMYASEKYLERLRKSGNGNRANDARWNFISPQYALTGGERTPAFRFVTETYNASGQLVAYDYIQQPLEEDGGGYYITINDEKYPLTPVDAANNRYSIDYQALNGPAVKKTYEGDIDYMLLLNRAYPQFWILKCSLQEGLAHLHSPMLSRLAEMHLNLAEAYAKKKDFVNALTHLNIIRNRAVVDGGYPEGYLTETNALEVIDNERSLELAYEAQRTFDVYRLGRPNDRRYPGPHPDLIVEPTDPRIVLLIPQDIINAYMGPLTQNP